MAKGYIGTVTVVGAAATGVCAMAVISTSPAGIGPYGVTLWFIGLFVALSCWISLAAYLLARRLSKRPGAHAIANSWRRGIFLGGFTVVLVALSSLRQLNLKDALLLLLLLGLVEFYMVAKA